MEHSTKKLPHYIAITAPYIIVFKTPYFMIVKLPIRQRYLLLFYNIVFLVVNCTPITFQRTCTCSLLYLHHHHHHHHHHPSLLSFLHLAFIHSKGVILCNSSVYHSVTSYLPISYYNGFVRGYSCQKRLNAYIPQVVSTVTGVWCEESQIDCASEIKVKIILSEALVVEYMQGARVLV